MAGRRKLRLGIAVTALLIGAGCTSTGGNSSLDRSAPLRFDGHGASTALPTPDGFVFNLTFVTVERLSPGDETRYVVEAIEAIEAEGIEIQGALVGPDPGLDGPEIQPQFPPDVPSGSSLPATIGEPGTYRFFIGLSRSQDVGTLRGFAITYSIEGSSSQWTETIDMGVAMCHPDLDESDCPLVSI